MLVIRVLQHQLGMVANFSQILQSSKNVGFVIFVFVFLFFSKIFIQQLLDRAELAIVILGSDFVKKILSIHTDFLLREKLKVKPP